MYRFLIIIVFIVSFDVAKSSAGRVEYLPGFQGPLPFYLETGYVGVDENEDVQLFYYFIKSESDPDHDPLMLWITGGPGCSSISGLIYEIGPIQFEAVPYNGSLPTLILTTTSWTKDGTEKARCKKCLHFYASGANTTLKAHIAKCTAVPQNADGTIGEDGQIFVYDNDALQRDLAGWVIQHTYPFNLFDNAKLTAIIKKRLNSRYKQMASIIFLDGPVGTGFSYGRTTRTSSSTDIQFSNQVYEFMRKWFESHTDFISNPFYIGGDSYSGIPVPMITQLISNGNEARIKPYINLKGYVLGNPKTFPEENNYEIRFANGMGLISDELYKLLLHSCHGEYRPDYIIPNNVGCLQNLELYKECLDGIEFSHVLEPQCGDLVSPIKLPSSKRIEEIRPLSAFYCRIDGYKLVYYWLSDARVREALHVRKGTIGDWIRCSSDLNFTTTLDDVRAYHLNLSNKSYRSLIYSGDHDMIVPHQSTQAWINDLNYSVTHQWRSWKLHGQIAGYTETYSNMMTYATVKGGGHTAPEYKPEECFAMFKRWISHQPL